MGKSEAARFLDLHGSGPRDAWILPYMDSTHGLMHACSQTRPGPAAQIARPGQTGSTPRTLLGIALFPPECRVTEPLSNWKTSSGVAGQGHSVLLLYDYCRLPPRHAGFSSPSPVNKSAWYSPSLLPRTDYLQDLAPGPVGSTISQERCTNRPTWTWFELELELVAPMWWQQIMSRLPRLPRVHAHS